MPGEIIKANHACLGFDALMSAQFHFASGIWLSSGFWCLFTLVPPMIKVMEMIKPVKGFGYI
jgi:hypothetical protein